MGHASNRRVCCNKGNVGISIVLARLKVPGATLNFLKNFAKGGLRRVLGGSGIDYSFGCLGGNSAEVGIGVGTSGRVSLGTYNPRVAGRSVRDFLGGLSNVGDKSCLVLTNSVPGALPSSVCRRVLREINSEGVGYIISTANSLLGGILGCGPFLVGPGRRRLNSLFSIRVGDSSSVIGCSGGLRRVNTGGILISVTGSNTVLASRGKYIRGVNGTGNGLVGSINYKSDVMTNFATKCVGATSCSCTLELNSTYKGTATFSRGLTAHRRVRHIFGTRCGWKKVLVGVVSLLGGSTVTLGISLASGRRTVSGLVSLRRGTKGLTSGTTCGRTVLTERTRNSATVKRKVTIPRTGSSDMGAPNLSTVAIPGNISCNTPSSGPSSVLFVVTTPISKSLRLRVLSHLVMVLVRPRFYTTLQNTGAASRFLRVVSGGRTRGCPRRTMGPRMGPGNCEVLTIATYPANVTRACVTTRTLRGTNRGLNCPLGTRAGNSNNTGGILAGGRVRRYSKVVVTTSGGIRVTHFSNGPIMGASISGKVGGPRRLVGEVISKGTTVCRTSRDRGRPVSSSRGRDN